MRGGPLPGAGESEWLWQRHTNGQESGVLELGMDLTIMRPVSSFASRVRIVLAGYPYL